MPTVMPWLSEVEDRKSVFPGFYLSHSPLTVCNELKLKKILTFSYRWHEWWWIFIDYVVNITLSSTNLVFFSISVKCVLFRALCTSLYTVNCLALLLYRKNSIHVMPLRLITYNFMCRVCGLFIPAATTDLCDFVIKFELKDIWKCQVKYLNDHCHKQSGM